MTRFERYQDRKRAELVREIGYTAALILAFLAILLVTGCTPRPKHFPPYPGGYSRELVDWQRQQLAALEFEDTRSWWQ